MGLFVIAILLIAYGKVPRACADDNPAMAPCPEKTTSTQLKAHKNQPMDPSDIVPSPATTFPAQKIDYMANCNTQQVSSCALQGAVDLKNKAVSATVPSGKMWGWSKEFNLNDTTGKPIKCILKCFLTVTPMLLCPPPKELN